MHDYSLLCCGNKQNDKTFCLHANRHSKCLKKKKQSIPKQNRGPCSHSFLSVFLFTLVRCVASYYYVKKVPITTLWCELSLVRFPLFCLCKKLLPCLQLTSSKRETRTNVYNKYVFAFLHSSKSDV